MHTNSSLRALRLSRRALSETDRCLQHFASEDTFLSVLICSSWEMGTLSSCRGASMKSSPLQRACTSQRRF